MRSRHYRDAVTTIGRNGKHLKARNLEVLFLVERHNFVTMRTVDLFHLIQRVVYPKSVFIGCRFVGQDVGADKVFDRIRSAVCFRQDVMDIPSAVDTLTALTNEVIGVAVSRTAHKIAVEIFGILSVPIIPVP